MRCLFFLIPVYLIVGCSRRGQADEIMADMLTGDIRYAETMSGPLFHDSKFRMSDRLLEGVLADMGKPWDVEKKFDLQPRFFQIPQGMLSYSFVKSTRGDLELSRLDSAGVLLRDTYPEQRFYYRVVKTGGTSVVQVVLLEEFSQWKVCAILEEVM